MTADINIDLTTISLLYRSLQLFMCLHLSGFVPLSVHTCMFTLFSNPALFMQKVQISLLCQSCNLPCKQRRFSWFLLFTLVRIHSGPANRKLRYIVFLYLRKSYASSGHLSLISVFFLFQINSLYSCILKEVK